VRMGAAGKDGGRETGRAGADDHDFGTTRGHQTSLRSSIMTAYTSTVSHLFIGPST